MTISSSASTVTRNGNGVATSFSFPFKVWDTSQLEVYILDPDGEATKTTDWTASLSDPGGSVTYPAVGTTKLPTGWKIVILRNMPFTQESDYVNATPFMAETVEAALDMLTAGLQQVKEKIDRAVTIDPGSTDPGAYMTEIRAKSAQVAADRVACDADAAATASDAVATTYDREAVAADKATVAADKATVVADKATVAADKASTSGYKDAAAASATSAGTYRDMAQTYAGNANTKASEAAASASAAATDADDAEAARVAAVAAKVAAETAAANVGSYKHFATATAGQTTIDTPWVFDPVAGNIFLIIGGVPRVPSSYTLTDSNTITLSEALLGGETIAVYSLATPAAGSTPLYADQNLSDVPNKATALSNLGGVAKSANLSDLANAALARGNLGVYSQSESQGLLSRRNRLCNGDFRVDNINGGSAVTPSTGTSAYVVDNLALLFSQTSKLTAQRVANSLTSLPYSEKLTVAATVTPGATDYFYTRQGIEGLDVADLEWGTANAKAITIQFTVKVSVAGTYAFAVRNPAGARSYVFTAALSAGENTVVQTIPGDTSGTWPKDTAVGLYLTMDLGSGSNFETTVGAWQAGAYTRTSAAVKLVSNASATFEIGGIQIERGSFATALEVLPIQAAEAWCMRYHPILRGSAWLSGYCLATTVFYAGYVFPVPARVAPTGIITTVSGTVSVASGNISIVSIIFGAASRTNGFISSTVASGLTAGQGGVLACGDVRWTGAEL